MCPMEKHPDSASASGIPDVFRQLQSDARRGLSSSEAARRLAQYGANAIPEKHLSPIRQFLGYFWGPIPWMIEIAAVLSAVVAHWADFAIIMTLLLVNAGVGFWQEHKAGNAIAMLKRKLALRARVLRDGLWQEIAAQDLVPGDIILLKLGNIIPADVLLLGGEYLSVDQSVLTGESLPVDKGRGDSAYSGSIVGRGEMQGVVTATGLQTFFGKTAQLVERAESISHFRKAVLAIGNFLIVSALVLIAVILVVALAIRQEPVIRTILFALILTVAAIPVALPAVLSVTMAVGAERLARLKAIVSRLVAIEEMAGMDVLCADKTGTLTQNRLTLGEPVLAGARDAEELILAAALASERDTGDPIDTAVLGGLRASDELHRYSVLKYQPFDPVSKRSEAEVAAGGTERFRISKGAPQVILDLAQPDADTRQAVTRQIDALAEKGYRTLGVARTEADGAWRFLGLLPLFDPPREDSAQTIAAGQRMGIDIKMVTGDHLAIARQVSTLLHLGQNIVPAEALSTDVQAAQTQAEEADGFAQVFPEHKFTIVKALQARDHIVGIAVSGATDAARAAADLVLTAPGLTVIVGAVEEARRIFARMNSYAIYRIAETIRVLLFMTLSILIFNFYPVTAVMIVMIALLNDFPIMMIAYDNAPTAPRPVRWDMTRVLTISILLGVLGVVSSFSLFWIAETYLHLPADVIRTLIFLKLLVAGHLTIFLTRNTGAIWQRPWPSWSFFNVTIATKIIGTFAAVYGWLIPPIGWGYALLVWAYALVWFFLNSGAKIIAYRALEAYRGLPRQ